MEKTAHHLKRFGTSVLCVIMAFALAATVAMSNAVCHAFAAATQGSGVSALPYEGVYDGQAHSATITAADSYTLYYSDTTELTASNYATKGTKANPAYTDATLDSEGAVASKTVYYYAKAGEAGGADEAGSTTVTINPCPIAVTWDANYFTYDGKEHQVNATVTNKLDGDYLELNVVNNTGADVGDYTAEVYGIYGNTNYTMAGAKGTTLEWLICYLLTEEDATVSGDTLNSSGWFTGNVKLTAPEGYTLSTDEEKTWASSVDITKEGASSVAYQLREDTSGYITDVLKKEIKLDTVDPVVNKVETAVTTTGATLKISATEGTSGLDSYKLEGLPSGAAATCSNGVFTVTGLSAGTTYNLKVVMTDVSGRNTEYAVSVTTAKKSASSISSNSNGSTNNTSSTSKTGDLLATAGASFACLAVLAAAVLLMLRRKER